jgi:hypothetical protein
MYDAGKIITGIILFLVMMFSPLWYNALTGRAGYVPDLKISTDVKQCVEDSRYMKTRHMDLLNYWKKAVVRKGVRSYTGHDGKIYTISLTGTCIGCHSNKAEFCDRCHDYTGVKPLCWNCHNIPGIPPKATPGISVKQINSER